MGEISLLRLASKEFWLVSMIFEFYRYSHSCANPQIYGSSLTCIEQVGPRMASAR